MPGLAPGIHVFAAPNLVQGVMNDFLQWFFVLDNENYGHVLQFPLRAGLKPSGSTT